MAVERQRFDTVESNGDQGTVTLRHCHRCHESFAAFVPNAGEPTTLCDQCVHLVTGNPWSS